MELTPLRYFQEIARVGHMTRAASSLGVSQPALSTMLKKLEAEVGAELLHRTGRGVTLTEAGRVFLEHAEEALRAADGAVGAVRELVGLQRGSIRVGGGATATTYLLPDVISAFRATHAGLHFFVREAGSRSVSSSVLSGELDLGIVTLPIRMPGSDDLMTIPLVEDELRLIVPPKHRLATRRSFRWDDLAGESMVGFEAGSAVREVIDRAMASRGVSVNIVMELRSIDSIKQMVRAGIGIGFVSRFALKAKEGLRGRDERVVRQLAIVRRADRVPAPGPAEFEAALRQRYRS
ncbi:LysR family transcriptional regulator [Pyruvatibacter sp.]|uniref:LysR family transcriptional regulator n=1 Tax=Pyruvatibacter sp. TaxID=1981328 RepID=UPI0032EEDF9B